MFRMRSNEIGHRWWPAWLTVTGLGGLAALGYFTGGNPHAAAKHPGIDPMPYYSVGAQEPGTSESLLPAPLHKTGALVCEKLVVIKNGNGSFQMIVRPALDTQKGVPLQLWALDGRGPRFQQQPNAIDMTVYDLNGVRNGSNALVNCEQEQVTATKVTDAAHHDTTYVLTGPHSTTHDGDTVPVSVEQAINDDYVAFDVPVADQAQVDTILHALQQ